MGTNKKLKLSIRREIIEKRSRDFGSYTVGHPFLTNVYNQLTAAIKDRGEANLIFVFGPSGVGKTTLKFRVLKDLMNEFSPYILEDPCIIPYVSVDATAPESGNFNWKDYYKRALMELKEPLIDYKINYEEVYKRSKPNDSVANLRMALENALKYRKTRLVIIDEAQHLTKMTSGRKLVDQLDTIKSIADRTRVVHVLLGTYELSDFRNLSAQLSRRSRDIHFGRYRANIEDEFKAFLSTLYTLQTHIPLNQETNLLEYANFCYERSIGCIGILKTWLHRALMKTLDEGREKLTLDDLIETALSLEKCAIMASEAVEGERLFDKDDEENEVKQKRLQGVLGLNYSNKPSFEQEDIKINKIKKKRGNVGQRNPKRDVVGGINHDN